ncbi:MAG: lysophospholipid acyltransferase family protein [Planctomycetes bacterium]|nr:lysophospholipid acyltransferase family protein [Planctomycetota bacterium]
MRGIHARLVFLGLALARISPRWLWCGPIARLLARCAPPQLRRTASEQLEQVFGTELDGPARRGIQRAMFSHQARVLREIAKLRCADASYVERMVAPEPEFVKRIEALRQHGKGVIVVTPHFGNYELMPAWFSRVLGARVSVIAKRILNPWIDAALVDMRSRFDVATIYQEESPRKLLRFLSEGGLLGILPDADLIRMQGIFVRFLGREAWTTTGPANVSIVSGAPIVPAFLTWNGSAYRLSLGEPIFPDRQAPREEEIRRITEAWSQSFENAIRATPDHWVWIHARWKTTEERLRQRREKQRLGFANRPRSTSDDEPPARGARSA